MSKGALFVAGLLIAGVLLVGDAVFGIDVFFSVVAVIVLVAVGLAAWLRRPWSYLVLSIVLLLSSFPMFQLNSRGPSGTEVTDLTKRLIGWPAWTLLVIAVVGFAAGTAVFVQARKSRAG